MGLNDLINKAKDLLGGHKEPAEPGAQDAEAGATATSSSQSDAAPASQSVPGDQSGAGAPVDTAAPAISDEKIDEIAAKLEEKTPDNVDEKAADDAPKLDD